MERFFDLPYNFDLSLIDFYSKYSQHNNSLNVHSIYFPPFKDDYQAAKHFYKQGNINQELIPLYKKFPQNRQEYISHISYINNIFPKKGTLLLQKNNYIIDLKKLKFYIDNNITKFCVGSIEQAKEIKNLLPEAEITASITMKLMPDDLNNNLTLYKEYFENVVLWFPYNRNISLIKQLPKDFKYILLINCGCSKDCGGSHHWLVSSQEEEDNIKFVCPQTGNIEDSIYIPPYHLYLFDEYISYYKLQGREYTTSMLRRDIIKYTTEMDEDNRLSLPISMYKI